jgi:hypothetical protein
MAPYESLEEALADSKEELSAETGQLTNLQQLVST